MSSPGAADSLARRPGGGGGCMLLIIFLHWVAHCSPVLSIFLNGAIYTRLLGSVVISRTVYFDYRSQGIPEILQV